MEIEKYSPEQIAKFESFRAQTEETAESAAVDQLSKQAKSEARVKEDRLHSETLNKLSFFDKLRGKNPEKVHIEPEVAAPEEIKQKTMDVLHEEATREDSVRQKLENERPQADQIMELAQDLIKKINPGTSFSALKREVDYMIREKQSSQNPLSAFVSTPYRGYMPEDFQTLMLYVSEGIENKQKMQNESAVLDVIKKLEADLKEFEHNGENYVRTKLDKYNQMDKQVQNKEGVFSNISDETQETLLSLTDQAIDHFGNKLDDYR